MSEEKSYFSEEGPALVTERIKTFFDRAPHYKWEGEVGAGANGIVYKIERSGSADGELRTLAVKIAPIDVDLGGNKSYEEGHGDEYEDTPDEILSMMREKIWLKRLRNGLHIIKSLDLPDDPLAQTPDGILPHRMRTWIFMEYAENGGLRTLVQRHKEQYREAMPNRLLWRFFMCLVRGCLEMAYYNATVNGQSVDPKTASIDELSLIEPGDLAHQDLGSHNIVVGAMAPDASVEHNATPILKLIDFGEAGVVDPNSDYHQRNGSQMNLNEISRIMSFLILQDDGELREVEVTVDGQTFKTPGRSLYEHHDELITHGVDEDLLNLVYRGMALGRDGRLSLIEVARIVHERVLNRGHNGIEQETDQSIRERLVALIHNGDT
ncbi:uncharacterized protein GGS22DRAFT_198238 [Annulohypoxylon maeteangense]|uniref:uncharacterized protein n=1 Tax=Annulohypoxylon maeteangense TaxID=1927788 RepID=UPI0020078A81|nr:uncharacterized protein GGS22DRAFT_198238 [Annulohypoxylon maeteangense]KAI0880146.1 hypothetical protein GGS22DRAFT_198238 [Annulohypoxylon maeteangense]